MVQRSRLRIILALLAAAAIIAGLFWMMDDRFTPGKPGAIAPSPAVGASPLPPPENASTLPTTPPSLPDSIAIADTVRVAPRSADTTAALPPTPGPSGPTSAGSGKLLIPVAGIRADQLLDTYSDARSEGRVHNAIDIMAPHNAPVLAATDGRIVKLFQSERGGTTIYQLSSDSSTIYYYAHLDRYADGLAEGQIVRRGDLIAYVGDTGNAGPGNYHLHFGIWLVTDPQHYWDGEEINPYPLLR